MFMVVLLTYVITNVFSEGELADSCPVSLCLHCSTGILMPRSRRVLKVLGYTITVRALAIPTPCRRNQYCGPQSLTVVSFIFTSLLLLLRL